MPAAEPNVAWKQIVGEEEQQAQKDETSCPRTVPAAVHLTNTNWHQQERPQVESRHLLSLNKHNIKWDDTRGKIDTTIV